MRIPWAEFKDYIDRKGISPQFVELSGMYYIKAFNGAFELSCDIDKWNDTADTIDFETNYKMMKCNQDLGVSTAFASKMIHGKKLYNRTTGKQFSVVVGLNTLEFSIPFQVMKFDGLEIFYGSEGDSVSLKVLDTAAGTYSTIPNYLFNQFGYDVNVAKDYYPRTSKYDADIYQGMRIVVEYTTTVAKTIGINYGIHELK